MPCNGRTLVLSASYLEWTPTLGHSIIFPIQFTDHSEQGGDRGEGGTTRAVHELEGPALVYFSVGAPGGPPRRQSFELGTGRPQSPGTTSSLRKVRKTRNRDSTRLQRSTVVCTEFGHTLTTPGP